MQGVKGQYGELWGMANMLRFHLDGLQTNTLLQNKLDSALLLLWRSLSRC